MNLTFIHECSLGRFLTSFSLTTTIKLAFQNTEKISNTKGTSYWGRGNQVDLTPETKTEYFEYFSLYNWYNGFFIFPNKNDTSIFFYFKVWIQYLGREGGMNGHSQTFLRKQIYQQRGDGDQTSTNKALIRYNRLSEPMSELSPLFVWP